MVTKLMSNMYN